jgi:hypothetical protein
MLYQEDLAMNGVKFTYLVLIGTDCTGNEGRVYVIVLPVLILKQGN